MALIITSMARILDIIFGIIGLALLLRAVLPWFKVSPSSPWIRGLEQITEPLVRPVRGVMQGGIRWMGGRYMDVAPLAALFVLWLMRVVVLQILYLIAAPPLWLLHPGANPTLWLIGILNFVFQVYILLLMARLLLEWLGISYAKPVMRFLWNVTEPLLAPIRRRVPLVGPLDFSPLVAFVLLLLVNMLLQALILLVLG